MEARLYGIVSSVFTLASDESYWSQLRVYEVTRMDPAERL